MTIETFLEKAKEGGYENRHNSDAAHLLDVEAWKAVGKVKGWPSDCCGTCINEQQEKRINNKCCCEFPSCQAWKRNMHGMIDALADGKTIEQFLETL